VAVMNVDLAVMADFEFEPGHPPAQLAEELPEDIDVGLSLLHQDYLESEPWLWYRARGLTPAGAPLFRERRAVYRKALGLPDGSKANGSEVYVSPGARRRGCHRFGVQRSVAE
jgi:hypothetical protein